MVLTKRLRLVVLLRCYLDVDHLPRYLISKGSLLLTLFDAEGQQQLLSLQEATQLMESSGISLSQYQVYSHLMRAGYIVTRHPATWVLDDPPRPAHMASYNAVPEKDVIPGGIAATGVLPIPKHILQGTLDDAVSMPPLKRTKLCSSAKRSAGDQTHRQWWSPASATQTWSLGTADKHQDDLARFAVGIDQADFDSGQLLPRLRLLPSIPHGALNEVEVPNDLKLVYDVLKPNKHFSKGNPDDPKLVVCLSTGPCVPTFRVMQQLQQQVSPLPLQYAKVAGGEVAFHSMQSLV
ncbi:hypothetical protein ABBQ38_009187 [Trebouxia sp. C0009 RCD-2024]